MDGSNELSPVEEDAYVVENTIAAAGDDASQSRSAGAPAPPLISPQDRGGNSRPKSVVLSSFTRVTDVIYGQVSSQEHSLASPSRKVSLIPPPPLHPRTTSMITVNPGQDNMLIQPSARTTFDVIPEDDILPIRERSSVVKTKKLGNVRASETHSRPAAIETASPTCKNIPNNRQKPPVPRKPQILSKMEVPKKPHTDYGKGFSDGKANLEVNSKGYLISVSPGKSRRQGCSAEPPNGSVSLKGGSEAPTQECAPKQPNSVIGGEFHNGFSSANDPTLEKEHSLTHEMKNADDVHATHKTEPTQNEASPDDHLYDDTVILAAQKTRLPESKASPDDDIYDDTVILAVQKTRLPESKASPDDDIYDDTVILTEHKTRFPEAETLPDNDDTVILTTPQDHKPSVPDKPIISEAKASPDNLYGNAVILASQGNSGPSKPRLPEKPSSLNSHPRVVRMRRLNKLKQLQDIEEIYDSMDSGSETSFVEEIYMDSADVDGLEEIATSHHDGEAQGTADSSNGLGNLENVTKATGSDNDSTDYEDLIIYEELTADKDEGYQDIEKARAQALGLPENIRNRAVRIVKGRERRKMRRSIKGKSSGDSKNEEPSERHTISESGTVSEPKAMNTRTQDHSSSDDDTYDGSMSHDKARQVLDMLLEANNVQKIADRSRTLSVQERKRSQTLSRQANFDMSLPPELVEYHKDGIIYVRSQSEIDAEIRRLTESAPKEPPPLPGMQRTRAKAVTQSDYIAQKRKLKKTNTFPLYSNS